MKLKCTEVDNPLNPAEKSKMFSTGKTYEQRDDSTVVDDLGHPRFIGSAMSFIVRNDYDAFKGGGKIYRAFFKELA